MRVRNKLTGEEGFVYAYTWDQGPYMPVIVDGEFVSWKQELVELVNGVQKTVPPKKETNSYLKRILNYIRRLLQTRC